MKTFSLALSSVLAFILTSPAQDARFFRVAGPVPTKITAFRQDGMLQWTNTPTNATFTVQTATTLSGVGNWVDYVQVPVTNGVNTNRVFDPNPPSGMALIPAGSFTMGDNLDGDSSALPLHNVNVSAFYMDKNDVTESLWSQVYHWATNHGYNFDNPGSVYDGYSKGPDYPVMNVDWYDSVKWCNARSEMEGKTPAYYTSDSRAMIYKSGQPDLTIGCVNWNSGYRLPTEAEWEKAARGGTSGQRFPYGSTITESRANYYAQPSSYAYDLNFYSGYNTNYNTESEPYTSPVGSFAPNGYGLYDMTGNVWQWCWDGYDGYGSASQTDPRDAASGSNRVLRGGSWYDVAFSCRTASRYYGGPTVSYDGGGFRSVLPPGQ